MIVLILGDVLLDIIDELRWQMKMLPARFWKQQFKTHRRFF